MRFTALRQGSASVPPILVLLLEHDLPNPFVAIVRIRIIEYHTGSIAMMAPSRVRKSPSDSGLTVGDRLSYRGPKPRKESALLAGAPARPAPGGGGPWS